MFRWAVAGLAVFSVGMAAGGFVQHQLVSSETSDVRPFEQADGAAAPATIASPEPVAKAQTVVEAGATLRVPSERVARDTQVTPAVVAQPSAGEVIIAAVKPDRQAQPEWVAPAPTSAVKIARVRTTNSTLRENPIVQRELTRDIQQELHRVGCHSVVVTSKWDARTVKASAQFVANRNAVLPADRPDVILLSLLRSYRGGQCGKSQEVASTAPTLVAPAAANSTARAPNTFGQPSIGSVAQPVVRRPAPATVKQPTQSGKSASAARSKRKKNRSWRHKVHYGTGSDN